MLCYANANLTRDEQPGEALRFVEFWHDLTGHDPEWLDFDSKLTTYAELSRLNQRGAYFVTIRRRGGRLVQGILQRPAGDWTGAVIDIPSVVRSASGTWNSRFACATTRARCGRSR